MKRTIAFLSLFSLSPTADGFSTLPASLARPQEGQTSAISNSHYIPRYRHCNPSSIHVIEKVQDSAEDAKSSLTDSLPSEETISAVDFMKQEQKSSEGMESTDESSIRVWLRDNIFLGIDPTPDVIAIATIYFVEGALGLARLAQTFLLKDELHLGPAELSALTGIFTLPWTIKPLYGFLSDGVPLFGYRRRSYLILAGLTGCLSYSLVGHNFWGVLDDDAIIPATIACLILSSACIAFSDVVADGIVVQKTRDSNDPKIAGGLQSLCWGSAAIGGLLSAYFSGSLLEVMKPQDIFGITAVLPFVVAAIGFVMEEKRIEKGALTVETNPIEGAKAQVDALWGAVKQPSIYKPALFLFLWQSTPTSDGAFLFFMTDDLGFGPEFLGRARFITAGASLFGVWIYNQYLKTKPIKDILFWSSIISAPLGLTSLLLITHANRALGIPDGAFILGDDVILSILGEIAFLPTLVLAARLCPPGVEAVLFATLMSINNGAGALGTEIGALLTKVLGVTETNFDNLALLTVICNLTSLYPLFFIGWLDEIGSVSETEMEQEAAILVDSVSIDDVRK
jgi:folate/biopterin transporter